MIPGEPIAKARPRFVHKDKNGKALPFVRTYSTQEDEEAAYRWEVIQYLTKSGTGLFIIEDAPISITCSFFMKRPKSHYGTGKNSGILKQTAPYICIKKKEFQLLSVDLDEKQIIDMLEKIKNEVVFKGNLEQEIENLTK